MSEHCEDLKHELLSYLDVTKGSLLEKRIERLSPTSVRLLNLLVRADGAAVSRQVIMSSLTVGDHGHDLRTVDTWVRRLRCALVRGPEANPIRSLRGRGYAFDRTSFDELALECRRAPPKAQLNPRQPSLKNAARRRAGINAEATDGAEYQQAAIVIAQEMA